MDEARTRVLFKGNKSSGNIAYWMSRDQRVHDNWALYYANERAQKEGKELHVFFTLDPAYPGANLRHYDFMLKGLVGVEKILRGLHIPFTLRLGNPVQEIKELLQEFNISTLYTDFDPVRIKQGWKDEVGSSTQIELREVDTHNIIPCWITSDKEEFAAYTIRPKIHKLLPEYLTEIPGINLYKENKAHITEVNWDEILHLLKPDSSVRPVRDIQPGYKAGMDCFNRFMQEKITDYSEFRNDPNRNCQSGLSPYFHFGQISAQRIAIEVVKSGESESENGKAFLEELIVRRELSDNYCFYNSNYDNTKGFRSWAINTLQQHEQDEREYFYSTSDFEHAKTHDPLWNAAQMEMKQHGKMHGYMRMYWAKKILEWTKNPAEAMKVAIYLNDKYSLDGRDPNGYVGCAWSIGGVHDRAWAERSVYGKIRYMNYNGCKRKFDVNKYIEGINQIRF